MSPKKAFFKTFLFLGQLCCLLGLILSSQTDPPTLEIVDFTLGIPTFLFKDFNFFLSKDGFEGILGSLDPPGDKKGGFQFTCSLIKDLPTFFRFWFFFFVFFWGFFVIYFYLLLVFFLFPLSEVKSVDFELTNYLSKLQK